MVLLISDIARKKQSITLLTIRNFDSRWTFVRCNLPTVAPAKAFLIGGASASAATLAWASMFEPENGRIGLRVHCLVIKAVLCRRAWIPDNLSLEAMIFASDRGKDRVFGICVIKEQVVFIVKPRLIADLEAGRRLHSGVLEDWPNPSPFAPQNGCIPGYTYF